MNIDLHKEIPAEKQFNYCIVSKNPKLKGKLEYPNIKPRYKVENKKKIEINEFKKQEQFPNVGYIIKKIGNSSKINEMSFDGNLSISILENDDKKNKQK